MAATDVRPKITLACQECKHRNYITKKNRRNDPDRVELKKFCPNCGRHTGAPRDPLGRAAVPTAAQPHAQHWRPHPGAPVAFLARVRVGSVRRAAPQRCGPRQR